MDGIDHFRATPPQAHDVQSHRRFFVRRDDGAVRNASRRGHGRVAPACQSEDMGGPLASALEPSAAYYLKSIASVVVALPPRSYSQARNAGARCIMCSLAAWDDSRAMANRRPKCEVGDGYVATGDTA